MVPSPKKIVRVKSWVEVRVEVSLPWVEGVSNFLIELGSPGVVQETSPAGKGRKKESILAYFPDPSSFVGPKKKIRKYLSGFVPSGETPSFTWRVLREENWAEKWKENFKPLHATPRIVIKPPWEEYREGKGEIVIVIDPGMAFGTGTHPTTQMCLRAMEELIPSFFRRPSLLDFGTGSGILAFAAQKLGAGRTLAVDTDPVAVRCARENAAANRLSRRIEFRTGSAEGLRSRFDMVMANLLPQELLKTAALLARRVSLRGVLVVSGILRGQQKEIVEAFAEEGLTVESSREKEGWICLTLKKHRAKSRELKAKGKNEKGAWGEK
jgi:ribosomal protein L11 methyltransferase